MVSIKRTDSSDADFIELVKHLDLELAEKDGAEHYFYARFNKIDKIKYVVVAYEKGKPVSCGAVKKFSTGIMEIKRMFILPEYRGRGIATLILKELEKWSVELLYKKCILETGKRQLEALAFYKKNGYEQIANYGQYAGVANSICFEKYLIVESL